MSGLAAAVRLGMFGRKVLVLERHNAPGGLNSFYARGKRKYDVGLHALTNWVPEGAKGAPLVKLMRQLRIRREELDLCPQLGSRVTMAGKDLRLNNDYEALLADVAREFPQSVDGFRALDAWITQAATRQPSRVNGLPALTGVWLCRRFLRHPLGPSSTGPPLSGPI